MVYSQSYQDNKTNQESIKDVYKRKTNELSTSNSEAQSQSINVKKENYNPEIITGIDEYLVFFTKILTKIQVMENLHLHSHYLFLVLTQVLINFNSINKNSKLFFYLTNNLKFINLHD